MKQKELPQKENSKKINFFEKLRLNRIQKIERELGDISNSSGSNYFVKYWVNIAFDYISWGVIIVLVYFWWKTRGANTDCTLQMCRNLYYSNLDGAINFGGGLNASIPII